MYIWFRYGRASLVRGLPMAAPTFLSHCSFLRWLLPEQTIVRHDFVLLIRRLRRHLLRWRRLFVATNYFVQLSKLKFNDIFTCVRWRMDSGRGEHRSSADCQWQPLLSYLTALFSRWLFARTDYCAAWLCPPHPLLTLEKVAAVDWRMRRAA